MFEINPALINREKFGWDQWEKIKSSLPKSRASQRAVILSKLSGFKPGNKTIPFGLVLEIFPHFFKVSKLVMNDLNTLKEYRNGLFHGEASRENFFKLAKLLFRVIFWSVKFSKQNQIQAWGYFILNPATEGKLLELQNALKKSRNQFNIQRRVYKCHLEIESYDRIAYARTLQHIQFSPDFKKTTYGCNVCRNAMYVGCSTSQTFKNSKVEHRDFGLWCVICDFYLLENEYRAITSDNAPSLRAMYALRS